MSTPIHPRPPAMTLLLHPYRDLVPVTEGGRQLRAQGRAPGSALVWQLAGGLHEQDASVVKKRPGGLPLIVILPPSGEGLDDPVLLRAMEVVRPLAILPFHRAPALNELTTVLRRPPQDLGVEVTDYLAWRGIPVDRETAHLIRRTITLSADLRSVSALCRSLYLSRRALGRRFLSRGLPVPSHWLHVARLLRVAIRLQNSAESVLSVGYELGYPDAFSLSNQMSRLMGVRPSQVRDHLGWEWLLETWLRREADTGGLAPDFTMEILGQPHVRPMRAPLPQQARAVAERGPVMDGDPDRATG